MSEPIKIKPMPWTEDRCELLVGLWKDGLSASQIARQLGGTSRNAVIGKIHRLGFGPRTVEGRAPITRVARRTPDRPAFHYFGIKQATDIPTLNDEPTALTNSDGVLFGVMEISVGQCRWPHGEAKSKSFHFCAHPTWKTSPYCEHHSARAWDSARKAASDRKYKAREDQPIRQEAA